MSSTQQSRAYRDEETLRELYWDEGMTLKEIADKFDTGNTTINTWMKKNGIDRRTAAQDKPVHYRTDDSGYEKWRHDTNGTQYNLAVHRLVMVAEEGFDAVEGMHVHHKNEIPWDNRPSNLELMEMKEHMSHHHSLDISDVDENEVRELMYGSNLSQPQIAERMDISTSKVRKFIDNSSVWSSFSLHHYPQIIQHTVDSRSFEDAADFFDIAESTLRQHCYENDLHELVPQQYTPLEERCDVDDVIDAYQHEEATLRDVAEQFDSNTYEVHRVLEENGVSRGRRGGGDEEACPWVSREKFKKLYVEEDLTINEIADEWDCYHETVREWRKKHDFEVHYDYENGNIHDETPWQERENLVKFHHGKEMSMREMADEWGTRRDTIYKWVDKHSVEKRENHKYGEPDDKRYRDREWLYEKYVEEGMGMKEIGDLCGCSAATIQKWKDKMGIKR